jgi:hypothetical protein
MKANPLLLVVGPLYAVAGLALTFAPAEVIEALGGDAGAIATWAGQTAGAGLLALGWSNWIQRHAVVGGIYGRPILLANLLFAATAGGAAFSAWRNVRCSAALVAAVILAAIFVAFALRLLRPPALPAAAQSAEGGDGH